MTDEISLEIAASRGVRAQRLLEDELLIEAFKALEDAYTQGWRSTTIDDVSAREKLFLAINIVGKVKDHLSKAVSDGKLAQAELKAINDAAERKKLFRRY